MKGRMLYSPVDMNKEYRRLLVEKDWSESRVSYWVTTDEKLIRKTMSMSAEEQKREIEAAGNTSWYRNIMADPQIEIWLPNGRWSAVAKDVTDSPNHRDLLRAVLVGSGFAAEIFGIRPKTMADEELQALTQKYRLIHIRCERQLTGPGGPGDLAWIWLLVVVFFVTLVVIKRPATEN